MKRQSLHGQWSSRLAFILAAAGSAVGLGNIWKFPYITGEYGGGAFVLVYLACILAIGLPIMMAEVMLGRRGRLNPINTMRVLAEENGATTWWRLLGWMGVLAGFLILSYYSVIAGWSLAYVFRSAGGLFDGATAAIVDSIFAHLVSDPEKLLAWHTIFMAMTMAVVARGVRSGLEEAVRHMMPLLFVLLLVLVGYALTTGAFAQGLEFLLTPRFERLSAQGVLAAMGQAFFTLSLGMGAIMMYGAYLPGGVSIARASLAVVVADTAVALLAGVAIFPLVFAHGLEPAQGPGLIFKSLPLAFGHMPLGALFGVLFFLLLVVAAWTSAISLLEPPVTWLVENHGMGRIRATAVAGGVTWFLGLGTIFSFNLASDKLLWGKTFFDLLDFLTSNIMLPLGGVLIAVFAGWVMRTEASREELALGRWGYGLWRFLARYIAPLGVFAVFLHALGLI